MNDDESIISVVIDGKPADARERCELFDFYARHNIKEILYGVRKIRHFSLDYAKRLAEENHV